MMANYWKLLNLCGISHRIRWCLWLYCSRMSMDKNQKPTLLNNPVNVSIFTLWQLILVSLCLSPGSQKIPEQNVHNHSQLQSATVCKVKYCLISFAAFGFIWAKGPALSDKWWITDRTEPQSKWIINAEKPEQEATERWLQQLEWGCPWVLGSDYFGFLIMGRLV